MMQHVHSSEEKTDRPIPRIIRITMGIAASIVLLVSALGIYTFQLSSDKTFRQHFLNYASGAARSNDTSTSRIPEEFRNGNYQEVIHESNSKTPEPSDQLLVAISYIQLDQASAAIPVLKQLQLNRALKEDADYYLGMAYLKNNQPGDALKEFTKIRDTEDHSYHKQVSNGLIREVRLLEWKIN